MILKKLIPNEVPDDENFAKTPIIAELSDGTESPRLAKLNLNEIPKLNQFEVPSDSRIAQDQRRRALGAPKSLVSYLEHPNQADDETQVAKVILEALQALEPLFFELIDASHRSGTYFPIDYKQPYLAELKHSKALINSIKTLSLKAHVKIILHDSTEAKNDLLAMLRIGNHLGTDPSIISVVVETTVSKMALSVIWKGLESGRINDQDLLGLSAALKNQKLKARFVKSVRYDRAAFLTYIDSAILDSSKSNDDDEIVAFNRIGRNLKLAGLAGLADSFYFRNKLNFSRFIQEHGLSTNDKVNWDWIDIDSTLNFEADLDNLRSGSILPKNPYALFTLLAVPALQTISQYVAQTATRINLARVAIALELYRREHGNYPATLAPLTPTFIDPLPHDLITGEPLHYRIKTDGTPLIYSIGLNKIDENDLLKKDPTLGDWVWQYTLPDDFNEDTWRE